MDRTSAQDAVGMLSIGFGAAALVAPSTVARLLGVDPAGNPALPLLTRMVGVRNATMGTALLAAKSDADVERALKLGLVVGASDVLAVVAAAEQGVLGKRAVVVALAILGGIGYLGWQGLQSSLLDA